MKKVFLVDGPSGSHHSRWLLKSSNCTVVSWPTWILTAASWQPSQNSSTQQSASWTGRSRSSEWRPLDTDVVHGVQQVQHDLEVHVHHWRARLHEEVHVPTFLHVGTVPNCQFAAMIAHSANLPCSSQVHIQSTRTSCKIVLPLFVGNASMFGPLVRHEDLELHGHILHPCRSHMP